jgi:formylglycine-generating enzyme required for sulfatase activity
MLLLFAPRALGDSGARAVERPPSGSAAPVVDASGSSVNEVRVEPTSGLEFVHLPGGTFHFGCEPQDHQCAFDEKPGRAVTVAPSWIGRTDVTVAAYARCVSERACTAPDTRSHCNWTVAGRERHPINCVDWNQAMAFCEWIEGRLPTSEEWEYAAKGGQSRIYPWGDETPDASRACYDKTCPGGTAPADSHPEGASRDGLLNMAGNLWQWVGTEEELQHTELRGGSWTTDASRLRASYRDRYAGSGLFGVGFRCVLLLSPN